MGPLTLGLLFGAGGLAKSALIDKPREDRQRELKAAQTQYSGWTKRNPTQEIQEANPWGNLLSYGVQGASFGQGLQNSAAESGLLNSLSDQAKSQGREDAWTAKVRADQAKNQSEQAKNSLSPDALTGWDGRLSNKYSGIA